MQGSLLTGVQTFTLELILSSPKVLAVIAARGGSKGLPRKNLHLVRGIPLIAWTIFAAQKATTIDRIILSSDDDEIIRTARLFNCEVPFIRPSFLSSDTAASSDVLIHALQTLDEAFDIVILLQPTSPLRTAADIDGSIEMILKTSAPAVISVCRRQTSPFWLLHLNSEGVISPVFPDCERHNRRQDVPEVFEPNGAIYLVRVESFVKEQTLFPKETRGWIMPPERSIDIDTLEDIEYLDFLCARYPEIDSFFTKP